ncbi:metal-dependent hydrolase [Sphingomicrobium sediminis]|uniref:Metal-dependent hydrolase n=1 Tax=Sphingomicrobium sediminis TaxID=2950949 RepID=A0A9X2EIN4_9SPHN|nr:metal-dependent hydrolase [Sphingomicrobium sediminis]MCM8556354.1 metal-dependent hydrolase [Sphingomicrobium sediminis]
MDNITHSLAGALLGQMGLKRLTARAMPTLIIAANLPDIDALTLILGGNEHLAHRRGITHGPIAMVVLPIILTGLVLLYDKWRPAKETVKPGWILACAFIGCLSHPALDWLNVYGIRFLEPFSDEWYAGDTLFIIDIWVWLALLGGIHFSRGIEKRGGRRFGFPAALSFILISAYIVGNGWLTGQAETQSREIVGKQYRIIPERVVAAPVPFEFWRREIYWRGGYLYGSGEYGFPDGALLTGRPEPISFDHPALAAARDRDDVEAYLFWSRMPVVVEKDGRVLLKDQRFMDEGVSNAFTVDLGPAE